MLVQLRTYIDINNSVIVYSPEAGISVLIQQRGVNGAGHSRMLSVNMGYLYVKLVTYVTLAR